MYYEAMDRALDILRRSYPQVSGLQSSVLGRYGAGASRPTFQPQHDKFVQIFWLNDHWVCGTNIFAKSHHRLYWYDSCQKDFVAAEAVVQVT
jgi:hypothetical protein